MPRGLPTPASSTDLKGADGRAQFPIQGVQISFELPPPAMPNPAGIDSRPASAKSSSASSYHPTSPISPIHDSSAAKRRQSASGKGMTTQFALPPPPSRSRKIIQMKPRQASQSELVPPAVVEIPVATAAIAGKGTPEKGKKKQPSSTSVAGRKIARKTAHSLIERRRRSKMNEEFGVLKDMIPACTGEMHKLAILQASIDYIRYLEDCVSQLKDQNQTQSEEQTQSQNQSLTHTSAPTTNFSQPPSTRPFTFDNSNGDSYAIADEEDDEDVEMEDENEGAISPASNPQPNRSYSHSTTQSHHPSISPVVLPQDHHSHPSRTQTHQRINSHSSSTTINTNPSQNRHYSYSSNTSRTPISTSATTSPNFGPLISPFIYPSYTHSPQIPSNTATAGYVRSASITSSGIHSQLTSPALGPVDDEREQENAAMAALMMLNCDRRGVDDKGRGNLSVRDLLSA